MSDQPQNAEGGQPQVQPEDPEYELEQHILFKRKQQITNHMLKDLISKNLSEFQLIMDGTNFAYTKLELQNKGLPQITEVICLYPHLRNINIGFNQLQDIGFLQKLKYVTELNLQRNLITDIKFLQLSEDFPYLKRLNLQGNQIDSLPSINLQNLIHLNLNQNKIKSLEDFQGHPKLQILQLRKNRLASLKGLQKLLNLKQLYLAQNLLSDFNDLKQIPKLVKLHARKNKIQSLAAFPQTPSLKYLNLRQNQIKVADNLKGISKTVQTLNLLGCPLSEELGDNAKKQIWMRFRNFERVNKAQIGAQQKQQFDKEYKDRLAQQERQRLEKQAAQRQAKQTAQRQAKQAGKQQ